MKIAVARETREGETRVAMVPELTNGELKFRIESRAELAFGNSLLQWLSDKLGGDKLATLFARGQIDDALVGGGIGIDFQKHPAGDSLVTAGLTERLPGGERFAAVDLHADDFAARRRDGQHQARQEAGN